MLRGNHGESMQAADSCNKDLFSGYRWESGESTKKERDVACTLVVMNGRNYTETGRKVRGEFVKF